LWRWQICPCGGDDTRVLAAVDAAIAAFDEAALPLESAYARRRRGLIVGGSEGRALIDAADATLRAQGVADPVRWISSQAPGFPAQRGGHGAQ
jgi:hypothetical protein